MRFQLPELEPIVSKPLIVTCGSAVMERSICLTSEDGKPSVDRSRIIADPAVADVVAHVPVADIDDHVWPRSQHIVERKESVLFIVMAGQDVRLKATERLPGRVFTRPGKREEETLFVADRVIYAGVDVSLFDLVHGAADVIAGAVGAPWPRWGEECRTAESWPSARSGRRE